MATESRQVQLAARPQGIPRKEDFRVVAISTPDPRQDEIQVANLLMSVDPYMRPRLNDDQPLDAVLGGGGIGRVIKSPRGKFREGDLVRHRAGFREMFNVQPTELSPLRKDPTLPVSLYLHALGATGLTAYGGMLEICRIREGEQVFVSAAAGAVGSVAAQIARLKGCYVVGAAGSEEKRNWLLDKAGLDAAINYKAGAIGDALAAATPNGLDAYFDNVGGGHLDAALTRMNQRGRIAICGMISAYNGEPAPVYALPAAIYGRITLRGFVSVDFPHLASAFASDMTAWLKDGSIAYQETILDGIERTADGMIGLFTGANHGKMLIRIADQ